MSDLNPQRKKVVVLAAGVACMSSGGFLIFKGHPKLMLGWIAFMSVVLVYTISEFVKLKRGKQ